MRHLKKNRKLGRTSSHRRALFANMTMALVESGRIKTTDAKAKDLRRYAEKLVTLGKAGTLAARRQALAALGGAGKHPRTEGRELSRAEKVVQALFDDVASRFAERKGGYTRIIKLGNRHGDNAPMSILEFVDYEPPSEEAEE